MLATDKAAVEGKAQQLAVDLAVAKEETVRERQAAEQARIELAKTMLRLEAMPRLEADLEAIRVELAKERQGRIDAEQRAAVLAAQKSDLDSRLEDAKKGVAHSAEQLQKVQDRAEQLDTHLVDSRLMTQSHLNRIEVLTLELERTKTEAREAGDKAAVLAAQPSGK